MKTIDNKFLVIKVNDEEKPGDRTFYMRRVLKNCNWLQNSKVEYKNRGIADTDAITILIPWDHEYVNQYEYKGKGWTIRQGAELQASYIVFGEADFEFEENLENENFYRNFVEKIERFGRIYVCVKYILTIIFFDVIIIIQLKIL